MLCFHVELQTSRLIKQPICSQSALGQLRYQRIPSFRCLMSSRNYSDDLDFLFWKTKFDLPFRGSKKSLSGGFLLKKKWLKCSEVHRCSESPKCGKSLKCLVFISNTIITDITSQSRNSIISDFSYWILNYRGISLDISRIKMAALESILMLNNSQVLSMLFSKHIAVWTLLEKRRATAYYDIYQFECPGC